VTPTARSLAALRELGYVAEVVERFNSFTKRRLDLIGCVDILAIHPERGFLGVQACTGASHAARADKMRAEPRAAVWIAAGGSLEVWSWSKRGKAGKRKVWELRTEVIKGEDIAVPASSA
jgi:hypothetical protein